MFFFYWFSLFSSRLRCCVSNISSHHISNLVNSM